MDKYINKIICGDCLEVMKDFPDKSVDLVLTDPPYGIIKDISMSSYENTSKAKYWDIKPNRFYFDEIFRISINQIIWGLQYFIDYLYSTKNIIFWDKKNGNNFMADGELAWTSFNGTVRKFEYAKIGRDNFEPERHHPTQKPLALGLWILERYSEPDDLILDCYCGSGSFCVAAKKLGRRYIGIDISEEYCQIARDRLKAVDTGVPVKEAKKGQQALFV